MREILLTWLRCPACGEDCEVQGGRRRDEEIAAGMIADGRGHRFPVLDGIPRVFPEAPKEFQRLISPTVTRNGGRVPNGVGQTRKTMEGLGFQWTWETRPRIVKTLMYRVFRKFGMDRAFLRGTLVLDAGCGAGHQSRFMADLGGRGVA